MCEGIITFVSNKGWYYAENLSDLNHGAIFVHQKNVEHQRYLRLEDRITFDIIPSRTNQGKTEAANVKYAGHIIARQVGATKAVQS